MPDLPLLEQLDQAIEAILAGGATPAEPVDLAKIAACLRDLPDENFKTRLKAELERRASMTSTAAAPIREGFRTVTPYITVVEGDKFIDFLKQAFGAEEVLRHASGPGAFHAEVRIRDSMLMVGSGERARGHERTHALHIYVDDCDATFARAIGAGATSLGDPADRPYGERSGFVQDAVGNHWYIATRFDHSYPHGNILPYLHPAKARDYIQFLKNAFGADEMAVFEQGGHVMHAAVRIGDAVIEMGEPQDGPQMPKGAYFMYVPDVDAVYHQAVAAGAASVRPPTDQPYGHRDATVVDPFGYMWHPATLL
jgi:PhnB protein